MRTYSFLVSIGSYEQIVEINALSEQEAIDIISREYQRSIVDIDLKKKIKNQFYNKDTIEQIQNINLKI